MDDETKTRIAGWLSYYQKQRGWTVERLAKELGMAQPTITNVINGKRAAGIELLLRMHRRLHRSADDLLDADPPK